MSREMFNSDQNFYMDWLGEQDPSTLCYCGWWALGKCFGISGCNVTHSGKSNADRRADAQRKG